MYLIIKSVSGYMSDMDYEVVGAEKTKKEATKAMREFAKTHDELSGADHRTTTRITGDETEVAVIPVSDDMVARMREMLA